MNDVDMIDTARLMSLADSLSKAKSVENDARYARIAIEEAIAALIPGPEKGQKTVALPEGVKITVERGLNYKADLQEIEKLFDPAEGTRFAPIKTKTTRELDVTGYEYYREHDAAVFAEISKHVTVTPKKVAVTLKAGK